MEESVGAQRSISRVLIGPWSQSTDLRMIAGAVLKRVAQDRPTFEEDTLFPVNTLEVFSRLVYSPSVVVTMSVIGSMAGSSLVSPVVFVREIKRKFPCASIVAVLSGQNQEIEECPHVDADIVLGHGDGVGSIAQLLMAPSLARKELLALTLPGFVLRSSDESLSRSASL